LWNLSLKTGAPFESRNHIEHGETKMPLFVKFVAQPQFSARGELTHYFGHIEFATRANLGAPGGV
jgi:hypothetical protein